MGANDRSDDRPAADRPAASPPPASEPEQGPSDDDPTRGLLDDEAVSVADRDLVEPGLSEEELGLLEIGSTPETPTTPLDEVGTPGDDETAAAADEFGEDRDLVAGSEPADVPGATDDLFPDEDAARAVRDAGEEGLDEDFSDALDDAVRTGDAAWRQSGPPDEDDDLGGDLAPDARVTAGLPRAASRIVELPLPTPAVALAGWGDRLIVGVRLADVDGVQLGVPDAAGALAPLGPPLRFADEEQRVVDAAVARDPAGGLQAVFAATDRAMIFRWQPGTAAWAVVDAFLQADGASASWLRLGVSREAFRLLGVPARPSRVVAWRPGGPVLEAEGSGPWRLRGPARTLRALVEDRGQGVLLALSAEDERAQWTVWDGGAGGQELPPAVADLLLAPGATAAARDGRVWIGCLDPEVAAACGVDGGRRWSFVPALGCVHALAVPSGAPRAAALRTSTADDVDELWDVDAELAPRLVLRATDLGGSASPVRLERLVVLDGEPARVWVLAGGRLFAVDRDDGPAGRGG